MSQSNSTFSPTTWFQVGDRVETDTIKDGIVFGFGRHTISRGGSAHKYAGVYIDFLALNVITPDGQRYVHAGLVTSLNGDRFSCRHTDTYRIMENKNVKIAALPKTEIWEGDIVNDRMVKDPNIHFKIEMIQYNKYNDLQKCDTEPDIYYFGRRVSDPLSPQIKDTGKYFGLVSRGNLWKLDHGQPLDFATIDQEAAFYKSLGMSQKVSSSDPDGLWSVMHAIDALKHGQAHQLKAKDDLRCVLIKYDDESFGKRICEATLKHLGLCMTA